MDTIVFLWSQWVWPVLLFLIGLNAVVFVHELGHFLAARWAGIRVERFALGMGPRLLGYRGRETDYCICALPIGGYVKMLGQEDFESRKEGDDAGTDGEMDPRSFNAKSVGKRLVVISAGVVMNVLTAPLALAVLVMVGMETPAPIVGGTDPTYPAAAVVIEFPDGAPPQTADAGYDADRKAFIGLQPGDRITRLAGGGFLLGMLDENITRFEDIRLRAVLANATTQFDASLVRTIDGREYAGRCMLGVRRGVGANMPLFGISPPGSLTVAASPTWITAEPLQAGDRLTRINGVAIEHAWDLDRIDKTLDGSPVAVTVRRGPADAGKDVTVTVTPTLGMKGNVRFRKDGTRLVGWTLCDRSGDEPTELDEPGGEVIEVPASEVALLTPGENVLLVPRDELAEDGSHSALDVLGLLPRMRITSVQRGLAGRRRRRPSGRHRPVLRRRAHADRRRVPGGQPPAEGRADGPDGPARRPTRHDGDHAPAPRKGRRLSASRTSQTRRTSSWRASGRARRPTRPASTPKPTRSSSPSTARPSRRGATWSMR